MVSDYLKRAGLIEPLEKLRFNLVGYGCTTCIGNSGPVAEGIAGAIAKTNLVACAILSGNRNFEGRINPVVRFNYLASPPLVVAYAIAGTMDIDVDKDPLGNDKNGKPVFLKDIWPSSEEIAATVSSSIDSAMFQHHTARSSTATSIGKVSRFRRDRFSNGRKIRVREGAAVFRWGRESSRAAQ